MVYHLTNKSIADFVIFNDDAEFSRMLESICYYQPEKPTISLSGFIKSKKEGIIEEPLLLDKREKLVEIIAYCLMPTHIHLVLREVKEWGIPIFINNVLNSYTRHFNIKHNRKGPLWQGRSKKVLVESDEQLLHLTRYIHLNPVTAYLVDKPEKWKYSSYREYLSEDRNSKRICKYNDLLDINPTSYRIFVEDRISYQRELAKLKNLLLE